MIFLEVISRYIFGESHDIVPIFSTWMMIWAVYFLVGVNAKYHRDMAIDVVPTYLSEKNKVWLFLVFDVVTLLFAILLTWAGYQYCEIIKRTGILSPTSIAVPMWIVRLCVVMGGVLLAYFSVDRIITGIWNKIHKKADILE
jgi:TRAP-type C4-dicarboxylate transport system permease small subunit